MVAKGWFSRPTKKAAEPKSKPRKNWRSPEASFRKEAFSERDKRRILHRIAKDTSLRDGWSPAKTIAFNVASGVPQITYKQYEARFGSQDW